MVLGGAHFRSHHLIFHLFIELLILHGGQERHIEVGLPLRKEEWFYIVGSHAGAGVLWLCYDGEW